MTDETALLAAAQADPTARLVYADCLDEQGKPLEAALQRVLAEPHEDRHRLDYAAVCEQGGDVARGEFIRVQVELATTEPRPMNDSHIGNRYVCEKCCGFHLHTSSEGLRCRECGSDFLRKWRKWDEEHPHLAHHHDRERKLYHSNACDWHLWLPGAQQFVCHATESVGTVFGDDMHVEQRFRRGFIEQIICPAADWLAHGDAIRAQHPVTAVTLTTWPTIRSVNEWEISRFGQTCQFGFHDSARSMFRNIWPGVTFTLPPDITEADLQQALRLANAARPSAPR